MQERKREFHRIFTDGTLKDQKCIVRRCTIESKDHSSYGFLLCDK